MAGPHFNVDTRTEYVETLVARCIEEYTAARVAALEGGDGGGIEVSALESVVNGMLERCWREGAFRVALGVALDSRRQDALERTLRLAVAAEAGATPSPFLAHAYEMAISYTFSAPWRTTVLTILTRLHKEARDELGNSSVGSNSLGIASRDWVSLARVLQCLGESGQLAEMLGELLKRGCGMTPAPDGSFSAPEFWANSSPVLIAMQIAFDLCDAENSEFIVGVWKGLETPLPTPALSAIPSQDSSGDKDNNSSGNHKMGEENLTPVVTTTPLTPETAFFAARASLCSILDGSVTSAIHLDFLSSAAQSDPVMLKRVMTSVDPKSSMLYTSVVAAHAFMMAGTTRDGFLRVSTEWRQRASAWSLFGMVASSGMIHKWNASNARSVLSSYLPENPEAGHSGSPYAEGGALFALGLIFAGRGVVAEAGIASNPQAISVAGEGSSSAPAGEEEEEEEEEEDAVPSSSPTGFSNAVTSAMAYFSRSLESTVDDDENKGDQVIRHGACLGYGLTAMGTGDYTAFQSLRTCMLGDKTVSGEAAGVALGLLLLGKGCEWRSERMVADSVVPVDEMLAFARDTQKEKVVRGIALGLSFVSLGRGSEVEGLIGEMCEDRDAVLRYGGQYALGLAYVGTGDTGALKRLLHTAVSDVSDDVRRAAVTNIGFICARTPADVPVIVAQLAESYNSHVRYGAAMATGIACAGSGSAEALNLLEPLLDDSVDFVKQGALIALGLVLQQENDTHLPRVAALRERLNKIITGKTDGSLTKMGAILALGLMGVGGQNCTVGM